MKAWRAKEKAVEILRGKPRDSYRKLPSYLYMVKHTNPGFLKAAYRGTILTACTQDAAGKILPFSFCLVDSENDASWKWFLKRIRETYGTREGMSIVSDRHESILNATSIVYPVVPHCVTPSTEYLYTVFDCGKRHAVNMRERICTCRRFHMDVMPFPVYPIPDESIWEIPLDVIADIVLPPKGKIRPGRPQKILTQKSGESRRKKSRITCGLCGQQDHNRQTYRNIPQEA
ncbi:uncharacterized protein [Solanum lycopersicum]|uniref:uncharacterized protein n=1 Tax=Solanum lycopersicum TaxID=4081 RepID=UPI00374A29BC